MIIRRVRREKYRGKTKLVVTCYDGETIPKGRCDNCIGCLGDETDEDGILYVFCSVEDEVEGNETISDNTS